MKIFLYIFLILLMGITTFAYADETWNPNLEISEFVCQDEANEGDEVNISATCRNPVSETFSARDVYLYIGVAISSPAAGEICHKNAAKLDPGETIECSESFTMPDESSYVGVSCYYDDTGNIQRKVTTGKWVTLIGEAPPPGPPPPVEPECPPGSICIDNPITSTSFEDLVNSIVNFIFMLAIAIAPIMFIIAGFAFITAAGDPAKIQKAKDIVLWTAIGLMVVLMAYGIINVIKEIFSG